MPESTAPDLSVSHLLPRQHTPPRGRRQAVGLLVDRAVAELGAGLSPSRSVRAMVVLQAGSPAPEAGEVLDRRLAGALAGWVQQQRGTRLTDPEADLEQAARDLVAPLFDALPVAALEGCPHPGPWVASSVDEVPCAVHGYEDGVVDCLRRFAEAYLVDAVDRAAVGDDGRRTPLPDPGTPLRLWLGIAVLAAVGVRPRRSAFAQH